MDSRHVVQLHRLRGGPLAAFMGFIHRRLDGVWDALYTVVDRIAVLARNRSALPFCRRYGFESTRLLARVLHDGSQFYRLEGVGRRGKLLKCHRIHDLLMTSLLFADLALDHVLRNYRESLKYDNYLGAGGPILSRGGKGPKIVSRNKVKLVYKMDIVVQTETKRVFTVTLYNYVFMTTG